MAARKWTQVGWVIGILMWSTKFAFAQPSERYSFSEPHLGTIVDLTLYAPEETVANEAARAAFLRVKELDQIFSDYKPESEAMRLSNTAGSSTAVPVSTELFEVLEQSLEISAQTEGAFDVTIGPLVKLWRRARKEKVLPTPAEIGAAKDLVGWKMVRLNKLNRTVELDRAGMRLDFGGIAKGYISQAVSQLLRDRGLSQTLVALSGDIVAGDPPPDTMGWKVAVEPLQRQSSSFSRLLLLKNNAVSTSGDAFQFVEIAGVRYSHIVDPLTGIGLTRRSSATVISPQGATADGLATAVNVLGPQQGLRFIESQEQMAVLILLATEAGVQSWESKSFEQWEAK